MNAPWGLGSHVSVADIDEDAVRLANGVGIAVVRPLAFLVFQLAQRMMTALRGSVLAP